MFQMHSWVLFFQLLYENVYRLFIVRVLFQKPPKIKNPVNVKSGDRGGHKFQQIIRSQNNSHIINNAQFAVSAVVTLCSVPSNNMKLR
jgi:hypothetical protein